MSDGRESRSDQVEKTWDRRSGYEQEPFDAFEGSADERQETMSGYVGDIEKETRDNECFRRVVYTAENTQLVVMSLKPGEDIGMEVHPGLDQFIRFETGKGQVVLDGSTHEIADDWATVIPAGTRHNVINTSGSESLKLYTIYAPPQHPAGTIHQDKADALEAEHDAHPE